MSAPLTSEHKVVVTGGAGFIGSHLLDLLLEQGHEVTIIDNLSVGRQENFAHHVNNNRFRFLEADVSDFDAILPAFQDVDWVFHLAGLADIVPSIDRPLEYHRANVDGTAAALEAARLSGARRFIYSASASCYGIADVTPTPETADLRPMYPYALTKLIGEQCVLHWSQVYGMPCASLRLFNVYGPRARTSGSYGAVFGVFLAQKLVGKPFTVVGDGSQTRDFTFVSDVARAFLCAAENDGDGEVFNIGSGGSYSIKHLVDLLGGDVTYVPKRPGEPDCTSADITKADRVLHWRPQVTFENGVRVMLEHIKDWREAPVWDKVSIASSTQQWFHHLGERKPPGR